MSEFWKKIKNVFSTAEASSSIHPTIHEVIERSEEELADYEQWKNSLAARRLIDWLKNEYFTYLTSPKNIDSSINFLNSTSQKGFVIHFSNMEYRLKEITFLFDYLKERVKELPYRIYVSDTRTYPKNDFVETIHRHYLKPSLKLKVAGQKAGQAFGNIKIEMLLKNDKIVDLKFSTTTYRDHQFKEAGDFNDLMKELFV